MKLLFAKILTILSYLFLGLGLLVGTGGMVGVALDNLEPVKVLIGAALFIAIAWVLSMVGQSLLPVFRRQRRSSGKSTLMFLFMLFSGIGTFSFLVCFFIEREGQPLFAGLTAVFALIFWLSYRRYQKP